MLRAILSSQEGSKLGIYVKSEELKCTDTT